MCKVTLWCRPSLGYMDITLCWESNSAPSSSYSVYMAYAPSRSTAAAKAPDTDLEVRAMPNLSPESPDAAYMEGIPCLLYSFLSQVQNTQLGETVEIDTDADTFSWLTKNFDMVMEMYQAKWELMDNKAIITIPMITHGSLRIEVMWAIGRRTNPKELLEVFTNVPVYNGIKTPDINFKESGLPTVVFEVSYSEARMKLFWDLIRLVLGLQGYLQLALGLNVYSQKELIYLEAIACWSKGSGILEATEAQKFQHGKAYGHKEDGDWDIITEQHQCNICILAKALFHEMMGADELLIISGADLWQSCKTSYSMDKEVRKTIIDLEAKGVLGKQKFDKLVIDAAEEDLGEEDESPTKHSQCDPL
ncbi:hypothetical protein F5146DRAFT_997698 [Armillaria mellea]|nr:hypothetical protein F5146DRAFT_997698 [Armillaria mellea]